MKFLLRIILLPLVTLLAGSLAQAVTTGDAAAIGKPTLGDLRERKMTVPLVLALAGGDGVFRAQVADLFAGDPQPADVEAVAEGIMKHGGIRETEATLAGYVERAKRSLAPLGNVDARTELIALADALLP